MPFVPGSPRTDDVREHITKLNLKARQTQDKSKTAEHIAPQPFWYQGSVLWKRIFPWTEQGAWWRRGWFQDDSNTQILL